MAPNIVYPERNYVEFLLREKWTVIAGILTTYCLYLVGRA